MCSKFADFANGIGCCESQQANAAEDQCAPTPVLPLTVRCSIEQKQDGDTPGKRLVNVDAMEEMCFYPKDECDFDCFQVCDCCGVITKWDSGAQECCKPVKYARRQRFTFKDEKTGCIPPQPTWPFKYEALCCPPPCASDDTTCCCKSGFCVAKGKAVEGLPCQSGVYYYNRTENKLILQTRDVVTETPPSTQQGCCQDTGDDNPCDRPQIIQPLIMPNGGPSCKGCCAPPYNNTCSAPCSGPCYPPPCCPPCGGPCCGPCCPPPPFCPPCCYPPPWCCNPCWPPPTNCCVFPPYSNPCCGPPPPCCCPCPPVNNNVCCPPPPPPPPAQTTVIPMCIPINPPAACAECQNCNGTVIDLKKAGGKKGKGESSKGTSGYSKGTGGYSKGTAGYSKGTAGYSKGTAGYSKGTYGYNS